MFRRVRCESVLRGSVDFKKENDDNDNKYDDDRDDGHDGDVANRSKKVRQVAPKLILIMYYTLYIYIKNVVCRTRSHKAFSCTTRQHDQRRGVKDLRKRNIFEAALRRSSKNGEPNIPKRPKS